jgi:predicted Zn-dependent peptidase
VIQSPSFKDEELALQIKLGKESLKQESEKTEFLAGQQFGQSVFGDKHPYGRSNALADYDAVTTDDLKAYHQSHYHAGNAKLFVYGAVTNEILQQVESFFGKEKWPAKAKAAYPSYAIEADIQLKHYIEKDNAVQTSIRIGGVCLENEHPDYQAFKICCIVLGGYFGSRLMSSVREEKGYTYGIHAGIVNRLNANYFRISTEVGKQVREDAVKTILEEIKILQTELMEQDELDGVRNYLLGNYVDQQSNFFQTSSLINHYFIYNKTEKDYRHALEVLRNITPEDIRTMAQRHLKAEQLFEVLAG